MPPIISVLMTSYNSEQYIAPAIESVLSSTYKDFEFIIVDDCSTDNTTSIIKAYQQKDSRIRFYINAKNLGDYPNRNKAASYATGKYIKYVDSDDVIYPNSLDIMVVAMEKYENVAFGFSVPNHQKNTNSYPYLLTGKQALRKHFLYGGLLHAGPSSAIIRTVAFKSVGGFSGKRYISDYEIWLKLCLNYDILLLAADLVWLRTHPGQENAIGQIQYYSLNYNLHHNFLKKHGHFLSSLEKKFVLKNYKTLLGRRIYVRLIKKVGLKKCFQIIRECNEGPSVFFCAFRNIKKFTENSL